MNVRNFEFKARVKSTDTYECLLKEFNPDFMGEDHQIDTYFDVPAGRLKLREGNIENALIQYNRENISGSKLSEVVLYRHAPDKALKDILTTQFGVKVIVDKMRKIYFIGNVKFHFDIVAGLGTFLEVEAIDNAGKFTEEELKIQCNQYLELFNIKSHELVSESYSDLILSAKGA